MWPLESCSPHSAPRRREWKPLLSIVHLKNLEKGLLKSELIWQHMMMVSHLLIPYPTPFLKHVNSIV